MCLKPITIRNKAKDALLSGRKYMEVPCGKCIECLTDRQNAWIYRLFLEQDNSEHSLFVTITYDMVNLPLSLEDGTKERYIDYIKRKSIDYCEPTLYPDDFTLYMKRLRKNAKLKDCKYFMCGEYGSDDGRPHYHMAFFYNRANPEFVESVIESAWPFGFVTIEPLIQNRIAYVCKYITEESDTPVMKLQHPYYNRQSHGIGLKGYLREKEYYGEFYKTAILPNGTVIQSPRYFKKKFYDFSNYQYLNQLHYDDIKRKNTQRLIERLRQDAKIKLRNPTDLELEQYVRSHNDNERKDQLLRQRLKSRRANL